MSYYFCIVGSRDNPLYQADLASKPVSDRSGPTSFFSSSTSTSTSTSNSNTNSNPPKSTVNQNPPDRKSTDSSITDVFGFGSALSTITSTLNRRDTLGSNRDAAARDSSSVEKSGNAQGKGLGFGRYNDRHVLQMIAHSSLDTVEDVMFVNGAMYLKSIDRINEWSTSAFVLPGNIKFLILHEHKHDDGIRNFFLEVWEAWLKISMNPFHAPNSPIRSKNFDTRVRTIARKHL